ncbi:hypothetical protein [Streptomyces sp. NPDC018031]
MNVTTNPNVFLTCVYNPDKALYRLRASQETPQSGALRVDLREHRPH